MRILLGLVTIAVMGFYCPDVRAQSGSESARYPRIGSDGANSFFAIWESQNSLYGSLSNDNGESWSVPQKIWNSGYTMNPQAVVYADGQWVAYFRYTRFNMDLGGYIADYVTRSADGINWTSPQLLYSCFLGMTWIKAPARLSMADMASDNDKTIVAFTGPGEHVYRSVDGGETWTSSSLSLGLSPYFGVDRFDVAYAGNQTWYIAYSGNKAFTGGPGGAFSAIHTSTDNGLTWTTRDTTSAFLMAGAMSVKGNRLTVFSDNQFNFSRDKGAFWDTSITAQPDSLNSLIANSEGKWVAATKETFYTTIDPAVGWTTSQPPAVPEEGTAEWPVLASNGKRIGLARSYSENWNAWPLQAEILFQYSDDGGLTWSTANTISEVPAAANDWQLFR